MLFTRLILLFLFLTAPTLGQSSPSSLNFTNKNHKSLIRFSIDAGVYDRAYEKYHQYLTGDICQKLEAKLTGFQIDRVLSDLRVVCLAFKHQNVHLTINMKSFPSNQRAIRMIESGEIDTLASTVWGSSINENTLFSTDEVIKKGEFEKGVYVHTDHPLLSMPLDKINLNNYVGITLKSWKHDHRALKQISKQVRLTEHFPTIFDMLKTKRADFILSSFPSQDHFHFWRKKVKIEPIKGIKVVMDDGRKFIISRKSAKGKRYYAMLNTGLKHLRTKGLIRSTYATGGVFKESTENWQVINLSGLANHLTISPTEGF